MAWTDFEKIDDVLKCGFKVESVSVRYEELVHSFGGGLRRTTPVGHPDGVRSYAVRFHLPHTVSQAVETQPEGLQTRARYLWFLFKRCKADGNKPVVITCPIEGDEVHVQFAEPELSFERLYVQLWGAGVKLIQLRFGDILNPSLQAENPSEI